MDRVAEYVRLKGEQRAKEGQLEAVSAQVKALEEELLEDFAGDGVQSLSVNGSTVYLHRQLWASVNKELDKAEVVEKLREAGLGHFVSDSFNTQTLSSWLRDLEREEESIPPELDGVVSGFEKFSLRVRRS